MRTVIPFSFFLFFKPHFLFFLEVSGDLKAVRFHVYMSRFSKWGIMKNLNINRNMNRLWITEFIWEGGSGLCVLLQKNPPLYYFISFYSPFFVLCEVPGTFSWVCWPLPFPLWCLKGGRDRRSVFHWHFLCTHTPFTLTPRGGCIGCFLLLSSHTSALFLEFRKLKRVFFFTSVFQTVFHITLGKVTWNSGDGPSSSVKASQEDFLPLFCLCLMWLGSPGVGLPFRGPTQHLTHGRSWRSKTEPKIKMRKPCTVIAEKKLTQEHWIRERLMNVLKGRSVSSDLRRLILY